MTDPAKDLQELTEDIEKIAAKLERLRKSAESLPSARSAARLFTAKAAAVASQGALLCLQLERRNNLLQFH